MKAEVATGIAELKRQFGAALFTVREDGQGGAYVVMEPVTLGADTGRRIRGSAFKCRLNIRMRTSIRCLSAAMS